MSSRRTRGFAVVLGGAAAILGAALLNSATAHADQQFPVPPYEIDVSPPGNASPIDEQTTGLPPFYFNTEGTVHYVIRDPEGGVVATYDAHENVDSVVLPLSLTNSVTQVIDTTDGAPAVGTLWDTAQLAIPIFISAPGFISFPILHNFYESDPTGVTQDLFRIDPLYFGNYFSTGPEGTLDELVFFAPFPGGTFAIPLFDIPATASTADATDIGALWSDIAAMF